MNKKQLQALLQWLIAVLFLFLSSQAKASLNDTTILQAGPYTLPVPSDPNIDIIEWYDIVGDSVLTKVDTNGDIVNDLTPTVSYNDTVRYRMKYVNLGTGNLLVNGDFETPQTDWATYASALSDYIWVPNDAKPATTGAGRFSIGTTPDNLSPIGDNSYIDMPDHTKGDGTGNMFYADGSLVDGTVVYRQSVDVTGGEEYAIIGWLANMQVALRGPYEMDFYMGSNKIASISGHNNSDWHQHYGFWTAGSGGNIEFKLLNTNTIDYFGGANDFAIDDLAIRLVETQQVTLIPANNPPVARDSDFQIEEVDSVVGDLTLLISDVEDDDSLLIINTTPVTNVSFGSLTIFNDGTFKYMPNPTNVVSNDFFEYSVEDSKGAIRTGQINIVVTPNFPPITTNYAYTISEFSNLSQNFSLGISDSEGDAVTIDTLPLIAPTQGTVNIQTDGNYLYTPNPALGTQTDSFTYQVCDEYGQCSSGQINIFITDNLAPYTTDYGYSIYDSEVIDGNIWSGLSDNESDAITLNTTASEAPTQGSVTIESNGRILYTPNKVATATSDSFAYEACDSHNQCSTGKVRVSITPNLSPTTANYSFIIKNTDSIQANVLSSANDPEGDDIAATDSPSVAPLHGSLNIEASGDFTYKPNIGINNTLDSFTYEVCDIYNNCNTAKVYISITDNFPPTASDTSYAIEDVDSIIGNINNWISDPDNDNLTISTTPVSGPYFGNINSFTDSGLFVYQPNPTLVELKDSFIYQICDTKGKCATAEIKINITPNFPPNIKDYVFNIYDTDTIRQNISLDIAEPEGESYTINTTPIQNPTQGNLSILSSGLFTYIPNLTPLALADTFLYEVCDENNKCSTAQVIINTQPNLAPQVLDSTYLVYDSGNLDEDLSPKLIDREGDQITITTAPITPPAIGILTINNDKSFEYQPPMLTRDSSTYFEYQVCDEHNNCAIGHIDITVKASLPPITKDTLYGTMDTEEINGDLKDIITVDKGSKHINTTPVLAPKDGDLTINPDGTFNYRPYITSIEVLDTFIYNVCNDFGKCTDGEVVIRIAPNQPPVASDTTYAIYDTDSIHGILSGLIMDREGDSYTTSSIPALDANKGTLTINNDLSFDYKPDRTSTAQTDTFSYTVCAPFNKCSTGNIYIQITPNLPPETSSYSFETIDTFSIIDDLLSGISDPNGDLFYISTRPSLAPSHGQLTIYSDGTFKYTPDTFKIVEDSFIYSVCDERGDCSSDTVRISIAYNPPPVTPNYFYECYETDFLKDNLYKGIYDPDGYPVTLNATPVISPRRGTVSISEDGTFHYLPLTPLIMHPDSFYYSACDSANKCSIGKVYISVYNEAPVDITVDEYICQGNEAIPISYSTSSTPDVYSIRYNDKLLDQGFKDMVRYDITTPGELSINQNSSIDPNYYAPSLLLEEDTMRSIVMPVAFTILYPSDILAQKWNNTMTIYSKDYNGGYEFSGYRWMVDGVYIDESPKYTSLRGERSSILYFPPGALIDTSAQFSCELKRTKDEVWMNSCPKKMQLRDFSSSNVYPIMLRTQESMTVTSIFNEGNVKIWDIHGNLHASYSISNSQESIPAPNKKGVYMVEIRGVNGNYETKKIVVR